uniref:Uncharacterized protein n=1 Tax=Cacopsylla melanoneura TaxID=428564 RepID=A0A8D8YSU4_9HEMI
MTIAWRLLSRMSILVIVVSCLYINIVYGQDTGMNCEFPGIDRASLAQDVLGDAEKRSVCSLPRPDSMCDRVGKADAACIRIARAVGGVKSPRCSHKNTCSFVVKRPAQHPSRPGTAHVSLCRPEFIGVIFPCIENQLIIADPDFRNLE